MNKFSVVPVVMSIVLGGSCGVRAGECDAILNDALVAVLAQSNGVSIENVYENVFQHEYSKHKSRNTKLGASVSRYFTDNLSEKEYEALRNEFYFWQNLSLPMEVSRSLVAPIANDEAVRVWLECVKNQAVSISYKSIGRKDVIVKVEYSRSNGDPDKIQVSKVLAVNLSLKGSISTPLEEGAVLRDGQSISGLFARDAADAPAAIILEFQPPIATLREFIAPQNNKKMETIGGDWTAFVRAMHRPHPANGKLGDPDSRCHLMMDANVELSHDTNRCLVSLRVVADEGRHDWSYGEGEQKFVLYQAPPGFRIQSIATPEQRLDSLQYAEAGAKGIGACEGRDFFVAGQGGATARGVVAEWDCVGDQNGPELLGSTGCRARLHDIVLIIEPVCE